MKGGIVADLVAAKWQLWHAKRAKDETAIRAAEERVDMLLETIIERQADL